MESKIEMTLRQMGEVLSNHFPPSHARLYALRRLGVEVPKVHRTLRKKELTVEDRGKLKNLLQDLEFTLIIMVSFKNIILTCGNKM